MMAKSSLSNAMKSLKQKRSSESIWARNVNQNNKSPSIIFSKYNRIIVESFFKDISIFKVIVKGIITNDNL